jgi:SulP family sulfate permease
VGQGLASIVSGLFGGMPATGAIARTAVNVRSGARTRLSAVVHSLALLAVVYLAATVVARIPLAALAGVLMVTAVRMVAPRAVRHVIRSSRGDAAVFVITALVTLTFDLVVAVCIGIAAAAFFALRAVSARSGVHREELPGEAADGDGRIALFRFDGALFFGAADRLSDRISSHDGIDVVILRLSQLQLLDATGAHTLAALVSTLERRGITVLIKGVRPEHIRLLREVGATRALRHPNHLFDELESAVAHARSHIDRAPAA